MESTQQVTQEQARAAARVMSAYRQQEKATKAEEARRAAAAEAADRRKWRLLALAAGLSIPTVSLAIHFWQVTLVICGVATMTLVWRVGGLVSPALMRLIETRRGLAVLEARKDDDIRFMMDNPNWKVITNA